VLSPAPELAGGLVFPDLPTSTTVSELKIKIKDKIPSHPPVERLRVICQGQRARDTETIAEVFSRSPVSSNYARSNDGH